MQDLERPSYGMPRRMTPSQLQSQLRQAQARQRAAVQKVNSGIRAYNSQVQRYNAARRRAIDDYNRQVREHNSRVRANRAKLNSALGRLRARRVALPRAELYESAVGLSVVCQSLERSDIDPDLVDLAERDTANSLSVANVLLDEESDPYFAGQSLSETAIAGQLERYSPELRDRWAGALYALNPKNPDAARHFCSSAREIISGIIDTEARDSDVLHRFPNADLTPQGAPTRRAKIRYCLDRSGRASEVLGDFGEADINDLLTLFKELNTGTHGPAGRFSLTHLTAIKARVEDAIDFVCEVASE